MSESCNKVDFYFTYNEGEPTGDRLTPNSVYFDVNEDLSAVRGYVSGRNGTFALPFGGQSFDPIPTGVLLGRYSPGLGDPEPIQLGDGFDISSLGELTFSGGFKVKNSAGTDQFDVDLSSDIRFAGTGDTSISFNPSTRTVTIHSVPGAGGGGAVTTFNGRDGAVFPELGDYNTSIVAEGSNLYFTENRVRLTPLTGYSVGANSAIAATDTVLGAFGKVQGQINNRVPSTRTIGISGTTGNIAISGGVQNLSANRTWMIDLATTGITPGTYTKLVVDSFGRSTSGGALLASDIPNLDASKITTGIIPIERGGTGLGSVGTSGQVLRVNSASNGLEYYTVPAATIPSLDQVLTVGNTSDKDITIIGSNPFVSTWVGVEHVDSWNRAYLVAGPFGGSLDLGRVGQEYTFTISATEYSMVATIDDGFIRSSVDPVHMEDLTRKNYVDNQILTRFPVPTGTTAQYIRGNGSLATFPTIPAQVNLSSGTGINITGSYPNLTIVNTAPNATHTGDVTGSVSLTISNNAVTYAKIQQVSANSLLGNNTGSSANVTSLTPAQIRTMLNVADGANNYTHPTQSAISVTATGVEVMSGVTINTLGHTTAFSKRTLPTATDSVTGVLSSANWTTFNNKQAALVSGTNIKTINGVAVLGSGNMVVGGVNVKNTGGTSQWITSDSNPDIRFAGGGDTSVSFNATTRTVTITSVPGSGTGGAVTSFNGRTGPVVAESGDYNLSMMGDISLSGLANLQILRYNSGSSSWGNATLNTTIVPEGDNLYFTNARSRSAISLTTTGSGAATYNTGTGVLNVPTFSMSRYFPYSNTDQLIPDQLFTGDVDTINWTGSMMVSSAATGNKAYANAYAHYQMNTGAVTGVVLALNVNPADSAATTIGAIKSRTGSKWYELPALNKNNTFNNVNIFRPLVGEAVYNSTDSVQIQKLTSGSVVVIGKDAAGANAYVLRTLNAGTGNAYQISLLTGGIETGNHGNSSQWNTAFGWGNHATFGYLTANQNVTLSGDVTGSGNTAITTTIAPGAVSYSKIQNVASARVLGRYATTAGVIQELSFSSNFTLNTSTGQIGITGLGTGSVTSIAAGNGMDFSTISTTGSVVLGTPSNVTLSSTNSVTTTSHTHALVLGGTAAQYLSGAGTLITFPTIPTVNNGTLTMAVGTGMTGGASFTANQAGNSTFTVGLGTNLLNLNALSTSGFVKKTGASTWSIDTNTYLTSFTEADPIFSASAAFGISAGDITNWNGKENAFSKGNIVQGTGISLTGTPLTSRLVGSGNITFAVNFGTTAGTVAQGNHNHDGVYKAIGWFPTWEEVTGKPSTFAPAAHGLGTHNDVTLSGILVSGEVLQYNGTAWVNAALPAGATYTGSTSIVLVGNSFQRAAITGDVTAAQNGNALTIANNAVTFAKMQNIDSSRLLGRVSASTGSVESLTAAQVRTLINVADGATANQSDAFLRDRANHTGVQAISTVTGLQAALDAKQATISIPQNTIMGRWSTGSGTFQNITLGANLSLSGTGVLSSSNPGGTVTSVDFAAPLGFSVTGRPITSSGTITLSYASGYTGFTTAEQTKLSGIESGANNYVHPISGVSAGTYNNLTVNTTGHVTAGNNIAYLTTETDPTVPAHVKTITLTNISDWNAKQDTISIPQNSLMGRWSTGSGTFQNVTLGANITLSGTGVLSATSSGGSVTNVSAGNGMAFTAITASGAVTLGTPSTITPSTTNSVTTTSHTHNVTGFLTDVPGALTFNSANDFSGDVSTLTGNGLVQVLNASTNKPTAIGGTMWVGSSGGVSSGFRLYGTRQVSPTLHISSMEGGVWGSWVKMASEQWVASQNYVTTSALPTNYVTTNSTQTGLTGNKTWTGHHRILPANTTGLTWEANSIRLTRNSSGAQIVIDDPTSAFGVVIRGFNAPYQLSLATGGIETGNHGNSAQWISAANWVSTNSANLVTTNTNQLTGLSGNKQWLGTHTYLPATNPAVVNSSIQFGGAGGGPFVRGNTSTGTVSFILRTYQDGGVQLALNDGGITMPQTDTNSGGITFAGTSVLRETVAGNVIVASPGGSLYLRPTNTSSTTGEIVIAPSGQITASGLSGTGTQMIVANASGVLSRQAIPSGGSGTVTNIITGTGITGGPITTTGTISLDTAFTDGRYVTTNTAQISLSGNKTWTGTHILNPSINDSLAYPAHAIIFQRTTGSGGVIRGINEASGHAFILRTNSGASPATYQLTLNGGGIETNIHGNSSQWSSAFSWGNHASAGYVPQTRGLQFTSGNSAITVSGTASTNLSVDRTVTYTLNFGTTAGTVAQGNHSHTIGSLTNVNITSIANNHLLQWDGSNFVNRTITAAGLVPSNRNLATAGSIQGGGWLDIDRTFQLVNDNASPGNNKYYGTNASGTKGFYDLPSGGGGTIGGSISSGRIPVGTGGNNIGDSVMWQSGSNLHTNGGLYCSTLGASTNVYAVYGEFLYAQVGSYGVPHSSAAFEVMEPGSGTRGSKPAPTKTTAQMEAIPSPVEGLLVYNETIKRYCFFNGTTWTLI